MPIYVLKKISTGEVVRKQNFTSTPPVLAASKDMQWEPYVSPPPTPLSTEDVKRGLTQAVQVHLDTRAQQAGYDNIVSACSYAGAPNPFQAEGVAFLNWRSAVWAYCYQVLADVQAQTRTIPTAPELIAELPAYVAP